ncbi:glycosyltransferase family 2 protein [Kushneria phyllosphaerae]|uniref:Teichuronic acid biosynthesis glycosyltransferase TuaG n=1 Tax=Kushneria phyllosphaerae TaxID=2100822 RepID=A0A2R8CPW6_9GAMM|nr:glycosyltransferase family A protein [Kushneria phyllosphaerae]SPJ34909.1 Putative teichuronic acid biosynthesis glycosyltransferase TuaG [Kushneria phyllosphaerae]
MKLSVVIPTYRSSSFIKDTLESVHQSARDHDYEIILVDDCSDDIEALAAIVAESPNTTLVRKGQKSNAAVSRNIGIEQASGSHIFLLDSDDHFTLDYVNERLRFMRRHHHDFCFGAYTDVSIDGERDFIEQPDIRDPRHYLFIEDKDIRTSTISFLAERKETFRFNESLNKHQDWGFLIDTAEHSRSWGYDPVPGVRLNCDRDGRMSGSMNMEASKVFMNKYLVDPQHISGFAKRHFVLAALLKDHGAYRFFSDRIMPELLKPKFKTIKLAGDALDRIGLFCLLPRLLGTYKAIARLKKS